MQERRYPKSFGFLLNDTARLLRRRFDQKSRHLGLTRARWQVLAHLCLNEGITQVAMAELIDIEPITLCRLADRMEEGGWLERRPDPDDRRARRLFATAKGRAIVAQMRSFAEGIYEEALRGLPAERRRNLVEDLELVRGNLSGRAYADVPPNS